MRGLPGIRGRSEPGVRLRGGVIRRKLRALFPGIPIRARLSPVSGIPVIRAAVRSYAVFFGTGVPVLVPECPGEVNAATGTRSRIIRNLIAAEGALKKRGYNSYFEERGIETILPAEKDYQTIRSFIEAVKQNKIDRSIGTSFIDFLNSYNTDCIILGCTEFPALISALTEYEDIKEALGRFRFINPLQQTIETLKQIMI